MLYSRIFTAIGMVIAHYIPVVSEPRFIFSIIIVALNHNIVPSGELFALASSSPTQRVHLLLSGTQGVNYEMKPSCTVPKWQFYQWNEACEDL